MANTPSTKSWFGALLGKIYALGVELELMQGLDFRDGLTVTPNADTKLLEIRATGGGGGSGHTIQEEGVSLTQRAVMNFVGPNVTATDSGGKTVITVSGPTTAYVDAADATLLALIPVAGGAPGSINLAGVAASAGTDPDFARQDHVHSLSGQMAFASLPDGGACSVMLRAANSTGVFAAVGSTTVGHVLRIGAGPVAGWGPIDLADADTVGASVLQPANGGRRPITYSQITLSANAATLALGTATEWELAANSTAANSTINLATTGTPADGEELIVWLNSQGHQVTFHSNGTGVDILVIAASTVAKGYMFVWDTVDWNPAGIVRV